MATAWAVYLVLAIGCLFSCVGGPLLLCRWIAIPFHLLPGLFLHVYAIFTLQGAVSGENGLKCIEQLEGVDAEAI